MNAKLHKGKMKGNFLGLAELKLAGNCRIVTRWNFQNSNSLKLSELKVTGTCAMVYCDDLMFLVYSSFNDVPQWYDCEWIINWKVFGRNRQWPNWDNSPEFSCSNWRRPRSSSSRARFAANIRTQHHPNETLQPKASPTYSVHNFLCRH
jgi:hypothetical protein